MHSMKALHMIAFTLLLIGGLNWLLVGLAGWDVGELFGGQGAAASRVVYVLVGLAAVWELATHAKNCMQCKGCPSCAAPASSQPSAQAQK